MKSRLCLSGEIFTRDILQWDRQFFSETSQDKERHIFFYGFSNVEISFFQFLRLSKEWCKEQGGPCEQAPNDMCKGIYDTLCNLAQVTDPSRDWTSSLPIDAIECFVTQWNDKMCDRLFSVKFCRHSALQADVYFCASPFQTKRTYLKFIELTNEKLPTVKISPDKIENLESFMESWRKPQTIDTYNVGQGNFSVIRCEDESNIVFDLGFTRCEKHENFGEAKQVIEHLTADAVIISHLDIDHILGVAYAPDALFTRTWIVSVKGKRSQSANRLLVHLQRNGNCYFIDDCLSAVSVGAYLLAQGKGCRIGHCSAINSGGLILKIDQNGKKALLPGDCVYTGLPTCLWGEYDFLLVPHHGCDLEGKNEIDCFKPAKVKESLALISCGCNSYGHPEQSHICNLCQMGYDVQYIKKPLLIYTF